MDINKLFDAVAPIYIYLGANVRYKEAAQVAIRNLRRIDQPFICREELGEPLKKQDKNLFLLIYNYLFKQIVEEITLIKPQHNKDGALGYEFPRGSFFGDGYEEFPLYADSYKLRNKITWLCEKEE